MNYQQLFSQAANTKTQLVAIDGLGQIRIKARDAAVQMAREHLFMTHGSRNDAGQTLIEPLRLAALDCRLCVVDDNGQAFLTEAQVLALPEQVVYAIYNAINDFSGSLNVEDEAKKS